jgi:hypothetical protein
MPLINEIRNQLPKGVGAKQSGLAPYLSGVKTARQQLLYQEDDSDNWYRGALPTASEIAARIVTVAKTDRQMAATAFDSLKLLQQQPSSPLFNPYTAATNASVSAITAFGVDTSRGITDEWVQQYSYLKDYYRVGASGTPLAPTKKSTAEENAAYHYYKILQAEDTTRQAETEWAALQEEIDYWTDRTDRNYSDEQVLAKIDWNKYPTLAALDEDKKLGTPTALNRAVDYSQDTINGALYAARNKSTGNAFADSVKYAMQGGSGYRPNVNAANLLDPNSDQYNPYAAGSTVDDAALYFGVSSFSPDWVSKNKSILGGTDKTAIKYYNQVQTAEDTTAKAETEWANLQNEIGYWAARTDRSYSDEEILAQINLDDYPTLKKLDAGRESGEPVALTRAIAYNGNDLAVYVDNLRNSNKAATTYVQNDEIVQKLDPASDAYSPYSVGSTIDDAALYFGMSAFDAQWLVDNKSILASGDKTAIKYYREVYDAEQFTQEAENERAELGKIIDNYMANTTDADEILDKLQGFMLSDFPILRKLDSSLQTAELYSTTRAIDYRWQDIEKEVRTRCAEINEANANALNVRSADSAGAINAIRNNIINTAGSTIAEIGTPAERDAFNYSYDADFITYVQKIKDKIDNGVLIDAAIYSDALVQLKDNAAKKYGISASQQDALEQQMFADVAERNDSAFVAADTAAADPLKQDNRNVLEKVHDTVYGAASAVYDAAGPAFNFAVESAKQMGESAFDLTVGQLMGTTFNQVVEESKGKEGAGFFATLGAGALSAGGQFNNSMLGIYANMVDFTQSIEGILGIKSSPNYVKNLQTANMNNLANAIQPFLEKATWLENIAMNAISSSVNSAAMMTMGVPLANKVSTALGGGLGTVNTALAESRIAFAGNAAQMSPFVVQSMSDGYEQAKANGANILQAVASGLFSGLMSLSTNSLAYEEYTKRLGLGIESNAGMLARVSSTYMASNWGEGALMWAKNALTRMAPAEGLQEVSESFALKLNNDMWNGTFLDADKWAEWVKGAKQEYFYGYLSGALFYVSALPAYAPSRVSFNKMVSGEVETTPEAIGELVAQVAEDVQNEQYKPSVEAALADVNKAEVIAEKVTAGETLEAARVEATAEQSAEPFSGMPEQNIAPETPQEAPSDVSVPAQTNTLPTTENAAGATLRSVAALDSVLFTKDLSSQTATIAAVLAETDADSDAAIAASKLLVKEFDAKTVVKAMRDIKKTGIPGAELAVVAAVLSENMTAWGILRYVLAEKASKKTVQKLVDAAKNITEQGTIQAAITESMIAERVKEQIGDGKLQGIQSFKSALSQAQTNLKEALDQREKAQREEQAAGDNLQIANARFIQDPTAPEVRNGMSHAISQIAGKKVVSQQMQMSVDKYETQRAEAKKMLDSAQNSAMKEIREQARLDVAQKQAEREADVKDALLQGVAVPAEPTAPESGTEPTAPSDNTGKRQFATETAQKSTVVSEKLKEYLRTTFAESDYLKQTNPRQIQEALDRIQQNGYTETVQELLDKGLFDTSDTVTAQVAYAQAVFAEDAEMALALASKFNRQGSPAAQNLQARNIFSKMTPIGLRMFVSGQVENQMQDYLDGHQTQRSRYDAAAQRIVTELLGKKETTAATHDARLDVDLTDWQRSLIDEYGLNKIARPGLNYNRATTKQRMLEAILAATTTTAQNGLTLVQKLEYLNNNVPVVTEADLNYIGARIAEYANTPQDDPRVANVAIARAYEAYANLTPETLRNKLRTYRYIAMLLSVPTVLRNIIGNTTQGISNIAAHRVAVGLDAAIGALTGKRTVTNLSVKERVAGWNGFVEETKNTYKDFTTDKVNTRNTEAAKFNVSARGRVYQGQFMETARHLEGFLLSVGDRNFWQKAYVNSMTEQQKLVDRGKMTATYEEMQDRAESEANFAIFTEDNAVRDLLGRMKQIPVVGEALDFVIPFIGVPTNIIKRMWQYSPLGLVSTAIKHGINALQGKNFNQNQFVMGMARGLTGTGLFAVGMMLKSIGMIRMGTGDEKDQKIVGVRQAKGDQYTPYILNPFTGEYVSLSVLAPFISPITMGAAAQEMFEGDEDAGNALLNAAFAGMDQIIDTSYLSSVQDILYNPGDDSDVAHALKVIAGSAVSQHVPNIISQIATALDPYVRDTNDKDWIMNTLNRGLISKLPWLRETLPEKVDITGQPTANTKQGARALLDPFTTTVAKDDPALDELLRLADSTGNTSFMPSDALRGKADTLTGLARPLTPDEKEAYKKKYGTLVFDGGATIDKSGNAVTLQGIRSLMDSPAYASMTDAEKANAISGQVGAAKDGAVAEMAATVGTTKPVPASSGYEKKAPGAMPDYFANLDNDYMKKLNALYEKTGDGSFIPTAISGTFSRDKKSYTLDTKQMETLWNMYGEELLKLIVTVDWSLPDEELAQILTSDYSKAQGRAKDAWVNDNPR